MGPAAPAPRWRRLEIDYSNEDWQSINLTLEFSLMVTLLLFLIFECGRSHKRNVYWPKRRYKPHHTPRRMPLGPFAWLHTAFMMPGHDLAELVGLDAYDIWIFFFR